VTQLAVPRGRAGRRSSKVRTLRALLKRVYGAEAQLDYELVAVWALIVAEWPPARAERQDNPQR
jgi:hypothetical protein